MRWYTRLGVPFDKLPTELLKFDLRIAEQAQRLLSPREQERAKRIAEQMRIELLIRELGLR